MSHGIASSTQNQQQMEVMMKKLTWFSATVMILTFAGCSDKGDDITLAVEDSAWRLQGIEISGGQTIVIPKHEIYTIYFTRSSSVTGRILCNTYGAEYRLTSGGSISFGDMISTEMACPLPSNEGEFSIALRNANSIEVFRNQLRLHYLNRTRVLNFIRAN